MLELKDQVCSLELAKRLKELGIKQESLFYWYYAIHDGVNSEFKILYGTFGLMPDRYSAFTVAELGEMLPITAFSFKGNNGEWKWECSVDIGSKYYSRVGANTEADVRAKMVIHLLEQNLSKVQEINVADYDHNEDYTCGYCGKEVFGRFLFCSKECSDKND